ncbi:unnamed protein product [Cunninghamella echinulata]
MSSLIVTAVGADLFKDVDKLGTQDPFLQATLNLEDENCFKKTRSHEDGGKTPQWDQYFSFDYNGEPYLYIEVLDKEADFDKVIGFSAIPLNQIRSQGAVNGLFKIYNNKQEETGNVHLVVQFDGARSSEGIQVVNTVIDDAHAERTKKIQNKELAGDVAKGVAVLGGLAALGFAISRGAKPE